MEGNYLSDKQKATLCVISATAWTLCKAICALDIEPDQVILVDKGDPEYKK